METPVPANHFIRRKTLGAVLITASALGVATTKVLSMSKAGALAPDGDPQCKKDFSFDPTGFCTKACSDDAVKSQYCPTTCAACQEMMPGGDPRTCIVAKTDNPTGFCIGGCSKDKTFCPNTCKSC